MFLGMLGTSLVGGSISGTASSPRGGNTSSTTTGGSQGIGNVLSSVQNILGNVFGGALAGPTGAAAVKFENERNKGHQHFHGAKIGAKWRTMDAVFKAMGKPNGLADFGQRWVGGRVPTSASTSFKNAENFFFDNIANFLNTTQDPQSVFTTNVHVAEYLQNYSGDLLGSLTNGLPNYEDLLSGTLPNMGFNPNENSGFNPNPNNQIPVSNMRPLKASSETKLFGIGVMPLIVIGFILTKIFKR
ncbi:MAG: hypothetical protein Wins2KO_04200 [Winogradskyella sp.]